MQFRDLIIGIAVAGSSLSAPAQAQTGTPVSIEQAPKADPDKVMLDDFDITDYAAFMKKRGFEIDLDKSGVGVYSGTNVAMLQVLSTRKVDGHDITVTDYLIHRRGRDFDANADPDKYGIGDLETRELAVRDDRKSVEYTLTVDYSEKERTYAALSNVIGTGARTMPNVSAADATLLLSRIAGNPTAFIDAERTDIQLSKRNVDGLKNAPRP